MVLKFVDKWVWDSWYVCDGDLWYSFFFQVFKSIGDLELCYWEVSYGYVMSMDLINWDYLGICFGFFNGLVWDDMVIWIGLVVKGDDGNWYFFYIGVSCESVCKYQKIGYVVFDDLYLW